MTPQIEFSQFLFKYLLIFIIFQEKKYTIEIYWEWIE
jgi:hypothetical protein